MSVKVTGSSDDLICVHGDIDAEFSDSEMCLAFSDGTVLYAEYTNAGTWRINRQVEGAASYSKVEAPAKAFRGLTTKKLRDRIPSDLKRS